ncbi:jg17396 [Pararge aegeria aegeria]|uniref:Regulatory protein zeste n=1 Tax=Pararge aegeria aegeria TaxID=348720 RepID=A0A8S4S1J1_9NEOP|nr:jg17396 [Pararge aegeria aegeria]
MVGKTVVSPEQMEILVSFMEENKDFGRGHVFGKGPLAKQMMAAKWAKLATRLNSVTGANKSARKWREYWNDKKYSVRKKSLSISGGTCKKSLDEMEARILNVVGKVAVFSEESVRIPNPFDDETAVDGEMPPDPACFNGVNPDGSTHPTTAVPLKRRRYIRTRRGLVAPDWAVQIEARRVRAEERSAAAFEALATSATGLSENLAGIRHELAQIRTLLETRPNNNY